MTLFILFSAVLTFTTPTARLIQGLERLPAGPSALRALSPEKWSMMINLALRFIPTIIDEAKIILKAQASRGADFAERSWKDKAKVLRHAARAGDRRRRSGGRRSSRIRWRRAALCRACPAQVTTSSPGAGWIRDLCFVLRSSSCGARLAGAGVMMDIS